MFDLPEPPDLLGAGDFDADGHWDIVAARRGGQALRFLSGDGRGWFAQSRSIEVAGRITALVVGEINRRDGLDDVIVRIAGPDGPHVLIFEGPDGALSVGASVSGCPQMAVGDVNTGSHRGPPRQASVPQWEAITLPAEATALALGQLDDSYEMDLAVAAGSELLIVHGRDRKLSLDETRQAEVNSAEIEAQSFDFTITSLAVGDFIWDREHRTDLALLGDDGQVHLLSSEDGEDDAGGHSGPPRQIRSGPETAMDHISDVPALAGVLVLVWRFDRTLLLIPSELRRLADQLEQIALSEMRERPSAASDSSPCLLQDHEVRNQRRAGWLGVYSSRH